MKLRALAFCVIALLPAAAAGQAAEKAPATGKASAAKGAGRTITINADDKMKYDLTTIAAKPGEKLHVVLKSVGTMPKTVMGHNFVLPKPGESALEINNAAFNARATDFIPVEMKDKILAFTPLAGPGETVEVTFNAPAKAGSYPYMCTFPGHFAMGMKGALVVK